MRRLRQRHVPDPMRSLRDLRERDLRCLQPGPVPDLRERPLPEHVRREPMSYLRRRRELRELLCLLRDLHQRDLLGRLRSQPVLELSIGFLQIVLRPGVSILYPAGLQGHVRPVPALCERSLSEPVQSGRVRGLYRRDLPEQVRSLRNVRGRDLRAWHRGVRSQLTCQRGAPPESPAPRAPFVLRRGA